MGRPQEKKVTERLGHHRPLRGRAEIEDQERMFLKTKDEPSAKEGEGGVGVRSTIEYRLKKNQTIDVPWELKLWEGRASKSLGGRHATFWTPPQKLIAEFAWTNVSDEIPVNRVQ